jgi:diguanylate cyclase (GGDEF)-like protein
LETSDLTARGISWLYTENKKTTLELMKKNEIASVLTIQKPPDNKTVFFLRIIMQQYPTTQRILLSTGLDKDSMELAINKAHINYFLLLPVTKEVLAEVIDKSFKRYKNISSPYEKINELKEYVSKFRQQAETDTLTQLLNRRTFMRVVDLALELYQIKHIPFSLIMLDLDHFKQLNDKYGHMAGDKVLRTFGEILRRNTRSEDSAFRYGGDEFAIITQMDSMDNIKIFIERILKEIRETTILYDKQQIHFTFSAGIAGIAKRVSRSELIKRADAALYAAKMQGRDRILVFEPTMRSEAKN